MQTACTDISFQENADRYLCSFPQRPTVLLTTVYSKEQEWTEKENRKGLMGEWSLYDSGSVTQSGISYRPQGHTLFPYGWWEIPYHI